MIQNAINRSTKNLTVDPGASGDSVVQFNINTTGEFRIGVDDTDDSFRISQGVALGTSDTFVMTDAGERTMPLQPAFSAVPSGTISNVTGDGTQYTVIFNTEIFDQTSDYNNATGIFTAAISGCYSVNCIVNLRDLDSGTFTSQNSEITTSNRSYISNIYSPDVLYTGGSSSYVTMAFSVLADMDASDTVKISITASGDTKTVDSGPTQYFSCSLLA